MIHDSTKKLMDRWYEELKDHVLDPIDLGEDTDHYFLRKPGTNIMSTHILFNTSRIIIFGDFSPCNCTTGGAISNLGYGIEWFGNKLDLTYLGSKFLVKGWDKDLALEDAQYELDRLKKEEADLDEEDEEEKQSIEKRKEFYQDILDMESDVNPYEIRDLPGWEYDWVEGLGYGYKPHDLAALGAIQKRFSELYLEVLDAAKEVI